MRERENVNDGEENAQFKAMHCTLIRCPGPGSCADPLMCATALFPNVKGEYRFWPAWRARESEIKILARRGHEKKQKARRFESLHDTTLCKVLQSNAEAHPEEPLAPTRLQVELQRWFRHGLPHLRANAKPESPCNYCYTERMVHQILQLLGGANSPGDLRVMPIWHDEQLHLAEWQALQQLDYLFNLTLAVDANNLAIEKVKARKKKAPSAEPVDDVNTLQAANADEFAAIAEQAAAMDEVQMEPDVPDGVVLPMTDKAFLLRLLNREDEVALAKQPGQGRREAEQCMRQAADIFGTMIPWQPSRSEPSAFGAAEPERQTALALHKAILERLREQDNPELMKENAADEASDHREEPQCPEGGVELMETDSDAMNLSDPISYAKYLCDSAGLTREQRDPVMLIAKDMQEVYGMEVERRARLTEAQRRSEGLDATDVVRLPLVGRRLR